MKFFSRTGSHASFAAAWVCSQIDEYMHKTRVLIVDTKVVVRRLLAEILAEDLDLEVVGVAANGHIALAKIPQVNPDLVVVDIDMPEMDGLKTLTGIWTLYPSLPAILFRVHSEPSAEEILKALSLGLNEYIARPVNISNPEEAREWASYLLIPRIKALHSHIVNLKVSPWVAKSITPPPRLQPPKIAPILQQQKVEIVAIGVSTGGPEALATLLPQLPANFSVPIVIVQHMPATFTDRLAKSLAAKAAIHVGEGASGTILQHGQAWIAPGNYHMVLERNGLTTQLQLDQGPPENSCRPSVDTLFRSVAKIYGATALAIVLTGMGQDGLRGCEAIRAAGGQVLVQDERSSVVWGMPRFIANAGLANKVVTLDELGSELIRRVRVGRTLSPTD